MPSFLKKSATASTNAFAILLRSKRDTFFLDRFQEGKALMAVEERPVGHQNRDQDPRLKRHLAGDTKSLLFHLFPGSISLYGDEEVQVGFLVGITSRPRTVECHL